MGRGGSALSQRTAHPLRRHFTRRRGCMAGIKRAKDVHVMLLVEVREKTAAKRAQGASAEAAAALRELS